LSTARRALYDRVVNPERRGVLLVVAAALLWSLGGLGIKWTTAPTLTIAFYRCLVAAIALGIIFRPRLARITPAFAVGVLCYAGCLTTFVVATKWTSAANAIVLQYAGVIWVMLLAPRVLGEPLDRRDVAAVGVAFAGIVLCFAGKFGSSSIAGDLVALVSSVCFAGVVLALRAQRGPIATAVITYGNVVGAVGLLPFVARDLVVTPTSGAILVALGVVQIALAYRLFVAGLDHVSATQASLIGMLEPIANPIWVFLALGERPAVPTILGGLVVLAAVAGRTLASDRAARRARPVTDPPLVPP
jgi:drug/metabolite transporter (DMT)-like permease